MILDLKNIDCRKSLHDGNYSQKLQNLPILGKVTAY